MWKKITYDINKQRNKLEIYHDILAIINEELTKRNAEFIDVQYVNNTSENKLSKYLEVLEKNELVQKSPLSLTEKGKLFLRDYDKIVVFLKQWNIYQELES